MFVPIYYVVIAVFMLKSNGSSGGQDSNKRLPVKADTSISPCCRCAITLNSQTSHVYVNACCVLAGLNIEDLGYIDKMICQNITIITKSVISSIQASSDESWFIMLKHFSSQCN